MDFQQFKSVIRLFGRSLLVYSLMCIFSILVFAQATTLEFANVGKYFENNRKVAVNISKLNPLLASKGMQGLPEKIVVSEKAMPYGKLLKRRIDAINASKIMPAELFFVVDGGFYHEYPEICYRGQMVDVPRILKAMMGTFLDPDQGVLALKMGSQKLIYDEQFPSDRDLKEAYLDYEVAVNAWLKYNTRSSAVLVMSNLGPQGDGTELYATLIKPCR